MEQGEILETLIQFIGFVGIIFSLIIIMILSLVLSLAFKTKRILEKHEKN